ncbi:MAG: NAD(P)/FAD-dependent oxidoreductase [Ktedonobacteraceae bacterium]
MSIALNEKNAQEIAPSAKYDVIVMGAGPYGLSISAHLLGKGLKVATFGKPNYFWSHNMPKGMLLRSFWWATSLSDPEEKYPFARYLKENGIAPIDPLPGATFVDYSLWFQKHTVPNLDETYVANIARKDDHYVATLEDGRVVESKTVVVAPGLYYYTYSPEEYAHMPASLVSHSSEHSDLSKFSGQKIAVIGRGQAALESAALLNESGADVQVITRNSLRWVRISNEKIPAWIRAIRAPQAGMGNGWMNFLLEKFPYVLHSVPRSRKDTMFDTTHGPAGSNWLKPRILGKVTVKEHVNVEKVEAVNDKARLTLSNGEVLDYDHVLLGTGYRTDVKSLPMLDQDLKDALQSYRGSPVLNSWFESNVPGLYFAGYTSGRSFGPFYRFVVGTDAAARRIAAALSKQLAGVR